MTDQTKQPVQGAAPVPEPSDATTLQLLVKLLLAERQQTLEEKQERQRTQKARDEQRKINADYVVKEKNHIQQICTHKKGGKGLKSPKTDYAVYFHTFTDATSYIRCQICGMKWRNQDTKEYLLRKGQKVQNHTGIGWREAYEMLQNSTNTASASEIKITASPIPVDVAALE